MPSLSRLLLASALFVALPSRLASQCLDAYVLEPVPHNPIASFAGRTVILIHGYVAADNLGTGGDFLTETGKCEKARSRSAVSGYWHADNETEFGGEWTFMARDLQNRGVRVFAFKWPTQYAISEAANRLRLAVAADPSLAADELVLVGHSMGGLVALSAVAQYGLTRVIRVVTLGTPLRGTSYGGFLGRSSGAVDEVEPDSPFIQQLSAVRGGIDPITYVLGGKVPKTYDCFSRFPLGVNPDGSDDCVVSVSSAYDLGGTRSPNRVYQNGLPFLNYGHSQIKLDYTGPGRIPPVDYPSDGVNGAVLREALQRLLISDLKGSLALSVSSLTLTREASEASVIVGNSSPATVKGLVAQVISAPAGSGWLTWTLKSQEASASRGAELIIYADPSGLTAGTYSAVLGIEGVESNVVQLTINLQVSVSASPALTVPSTGTAGTPYTITWSTVSGATSYTLDRSTDGSWTDQVPSVTTSATSYSDVIYLSSGSKKRYYRVRANNSGYSGSKSIVVGVPVTQLTVKPSPLSFFGFTRDTILQLAQLELSPESSWGASVYNTTSGVTWLTLPSSGRSGAAGKAIRVDARAKDISSPGTYSGRIEITCCGSTALAATVPASFTIFSSSDSRIDVVEDSAWVNYGYNNPALPQNRGKLTELQHRIRNGGSRELFLNPYGESRYAIYWSADSIAPTQARVDAGTAVLLETGPINRDTPVPPNGAIQLREHVMLPAAAYTSGTSYLSFVADVSDHDLPHATGAIPEANEANNLRIIPLRIPVVRQITTPATLAMGEVFADSSATKELVVENPGDAPIDWTSSVSRAGVTISPASGSLLGHSSARLTIRIDAAPFAAGPQAFTLSIGTTLGTVSISGTATVIARPVIATLLRKQQFQGGAKDSTILRVTNGGGGTLLWSVDSDVAWLRIARGSGAAGDSSWVVVDPSQLSPGTHVGNLVVDAGFAANRPVTLSITLTLQAVLRGDVTGDGLIQSDDAQAVLDVLAGLPVPSAMRAMPNGDADCNGKLEARDVQLILMKIVGRPTGQACVGTVR